MTPTHITIHPTGYDGGFAAFDDVTNQVVHEEEAIERIVNAHAGLVEALRKTLRLAQESLEMSGGCDHSVGICVCASIYDIEDAQAALAAAERKATP